MQANSVDYSIVVPVYFNEGSLRYTAERIFVDVFARVKGLRGEIVFVDDGSGDNSLEECLRLRSEHPSTIRVIKLSRNFGQVNAIWCGLEHTPGACIVLSADGQDPVDLIPDMLDSHFANGSEIVIATRASRAEGVWRRMSSWFVYGAIRKLGNKDMPVGGFDFLLLGARAKKALLSRWQPNTFFQIRVLELGFSKRFVQYRREERKAGVSRWSFGKKLTYMIDGVLGHSFVPIRPISVFGFVLSGLSFLLALFFFAAYFFNPDVIRGWTPIILLLLFVGGSQMIMIGVIGEYMWRILAQARNAPPYFVDSEYDYSREPILTDEKDERSGLDLE